MTRTMETKKMRTTMMMARTSEGFRVEAGGISQHRAPQWSELSFCHCYETNVVGADEEYRERNERKRNLASFYFSLPKKIKSEVNNESEERNVWNGLHRTIHLKYHRFSENVSQMAAHCELHDLFSCRPAILRTSFFRIFVIFGIFIF